jgi:hypothetical protein
VLASHQSSQKIQDVHVNICDLVDHVTIGAPVRLFDSEQELSQYSMATDKIFPRDDVPKEGLLHFLLRNIFNPGKKRRQHTRRGRDHRTW